MTYHTLIQDILMTVMAILHIVVMVVLLAFAMPFGRTTTIRDLKFRNPPPPPPKRKSANEIEIPPPNEPKSYIQK